MPFRLGRWYLWFRQVVARLFLHAFEPVLYRIAFVWRRLLWRTRFIAITGSLGKTTAKDALAAILALDHRAFGSVGTQNARRLVSLNLLRVRPWHRFAVIELGTAGPGQLIRPAVQVRPDVAIILGVAPTHIRNYRSLEDIAREKMQLLEGLKPGGLVVINGDEPLLEAIPMDPALRVTRFGLGPGLDLRAEAITSRWPDRLSFQAVAGESRIPIRTRLVGEHWVPALLSALLAARSCGVELRRAGEALQALSPCRGRLEPVALPGGAIVIRDEYNASPFSYDAALKVLEQARAGRRIAVFGDMNDTKDKIGRRLRRLGRRAAEICDLAVFVGDNSHHARVGALRAGLSESSAVCRTDPAEAAAFLAKELRPGDLVLIKGWLCQHLERLVLAQFGTVDCWVRQCHKLIQCDICWKLGLTAVERNRLGGNAGACASPGEAPEETGANLPPGPGRPAGGGVPLRQERDD